MDNARSRTATASSTSYGRSVSAGSGNNPDPPRYRFKIGGATASPRLSLRKKSSQILKQGNELQLQSARVAGSRGGLGACSSSAPRSAPKVDTGSWTSFPRDRDSLKRQGSPKPDRNARLERPNHTLDRPSSAAGHAYHDDVHPRPRLLRTSTSIPDHKAINAAFNVAAAVETQRARSVGGFDLTRQNSHVQDAGLRSVRESLRSAVTTGSSATEQSVDDRSSIFTDHSSVSDISGPSVNWPLVMHDDEMTVEDAIAMYSDDFKDEPPVPPSTAAGKHPKSFTSSPLAHPHESHSLSSEEHHSEFAPPGVLMRAPGHGRASISAAQADGGTSAYLAPSHDQSLPHLQDRLKALIGPSRDRYGFKKESQHIKVKDYDTWNAGYTKYLDRRRKKWEELLKQFGLPTENPARFPPTSDKVKRYVRKGIPPEWRGAAWFYYAGGPARVAKHPGLYDELVATAETGGVSQIDEDHIERDLYRTFPDHVKFKPDIAPPPPGTRSSFSDLQIETPLITSLRRVLQAFAIHNPRIGYCQSLNFLAGFLLIFLSGAEEKTFHLLSILTAQHLPGTHGLSLEGANVDVGVLMLCLRETLPALWVDKLDDRADSTVALAAGDMRVTTGLPTVSLATTGWFMGAFAATLPVESAARVWDCLWYEGSKTLFRVALALFKLSEREIRKTGTEPMEVFQVVQTLPKRLLDANLLMETATRKSAKWAAFGGGNGGGAAGFGGLSQKTIESRRAERRKLYRVERERVLLKALVMPVPVEGDGLEERFKRIGDVGMWGG